LYLGLLPCILCSIFTCRRAPLDTLFPYTTLFRSGAAARPAAAGTAELRRGRGRRAREHPHGRAQGTDPYPRAGQPARAGAAEARSEEHTSELQSRENLVCRLLLEKKKDDCVH